MWDGFSLDGYDTSGVDASGGPNSAPSIGPGSNSGDGSPGDSGPSIGAQLDGYLTGSGGGFPGLLGYTPAGAIAKGATAVMSAIFGAESIGPMGDFPGDVQSVSLDERPSTFDQLFPPAGKIDAGPVLPGTGDMTLSGTTPRAADGLPVNPASLADYLDFPAVARNWAQIQADMVPAGLVMGDPRATMSADDEWSAWFSSGPGQGEPLTLTVTPKARDWSMLLLAAAAFLVFRS